MLMGEQAETGSAGGGAWAELLDRHRSEWVASLAAGGPMMWVDNYRGDDDGEADAEAVRAAVADGRPVVVGLPADARGDAEREADRLAAELGGLRVTQRLAAGSLIGPDGDGGADAVHFLVCVNVEPNSASEPSSMTDAEVVPLMTGYVRLLEEANRSLSEANVRLAREKLGVHDSAAGALGPEMDELKRELAEQREIATQAKAALEAPRYRAVDRLRAFVFGIPGLSALFRLRSRLIQRRRR
jgi:hypothetical protein